MTNYFTIQGVKYKEDCVVFTVTDVSKGILESLYRRLSRRFFEAFTSNDEIFKGAFDKKYGSTTKEDNRNKGLPQSMWMIVLKETMKNSVN